MGFPVFRVGLGLIFVASFVFLGSWALVIWKPKYLLGNVTMLWFKTMRQAIFAGLILLVLGELNQLLTTFLFWRR